MRRLDSIRAELVSKIKERFPAATKIEKEQLFSALVRKVMTKLPSCVLYLFVSLQMRARIFDNWRRSLKHRIEVLARLL